MSTIEDVILDRDQRGISALRAHLPADYCDRAASLVLNHPGAVLIATGFYIVYGRATETDGPAGAIVLGDALQRIGYEVVYVTDRYTAPLMSSVVGAKARVVDFPITDEKSSESFADKLLAEVEPSLVIALERCGAASDGLYRNMYGQDITQYNARLDYLFTKHPRSVGIGDGGNEIGMGNLASVIPTVPNLVEAPCVTTVTELIIASVSNWGGYGLVTSLSKQKGENLLPSVEAEQDLVARTVDMGAIDGPSGKSEYRVDGFTLAENSETLQRLHAHLAELGISA